MRLGPNLIAAVAAAIWTAVVGLVVVPLYVRYLGVEAYGLIGFYVTLQALFQVLDLGLTPAVNRQIARYVAAELLVNARTLLHTLAAVYWAMAAVVAVAVAASAHALATHWLHLNHLSPVTVERAVTLIGLVIACRWPVGLYTGALLGLQRAMISSSISATATTVSAVGAVIVLAWVSPTVEAFFVWQASVGVILAFAMRRAAWASLKGGRGAVRFNIAELAGIWRFSAWMVGLTIAGLIFMQLDKIVLSKILTLQDFGYYSLAATIANGLQLLVGPVFSILYARFSALIAVGDTHNLTRLYELSTRLLATILFPLAMLLVFDAHDVVVVWTRSTQIADAVSPLVPLLVMGTAIHGMMNISYALQLGYGMPQIPLAVNGILLLVLLPVILLLALSFGAMGGALAWLLVRVLYLLLGTWLTHRVLLKGIGLRWFTRDFGVPFVLIFSTGALGFHPLDRASHSAVFNMAYGGVLALLSAVLSLAISPTLRSAVIAPFRIKKIA